MPYVIDYFVDDIRTSSLPTLSFVAGTTLDNKHLLNQLLLYVDITLGAATSVEVFVEFSDDNLTFFPETGDDVNLSTGVVTQVNLERTMTASKRLPIPIQDRFIRVSVKGTGADLSTTLVGIKGITGNR